MAAKQSATSSADFRVMQEWDGNRVFVWSYLRDIVVVVTNPSRATEVRDALNRIYANED